MSLQTIAQTLYDEAANGQVILNDALLGNGTAFSDLVRSALLRNAGNIILTAKQADIPVNPSGDSFSFNAGIPTTAGEGFLNLPDNTVTVTISDAGGTIQAQLNIKLTQLYNGSSTTWSFSKSFPVLMGFPFDFLPLRDEEFIFVYAPALLPPGLSQGLNFKAPLDLSGLLGPVLQFLDTLGLSSTPQPMTGAITNTPDGPAFNLIASLGLDTIDLTALEIQSPYIGANMAYARQEGSLEKYEPDGKLFIGATTTLLVNGKNEGDAPENITLAVNFDLPLADKVSSITLMIQPLDKTSTSLANLGSWMAGDTWDNLFKSEEAKTQLLPLLSNFGLKAYTLTIGFGSKISIMSTSLSVGTLAPWTVLDNSPDGKIVMPEFYASWMLIDPFGLKISSIQLGGELKLYGQQGREISFSGSILLPDIVVSVSLSSPALMTAADWLQTILDAFGGPALPEELKDALSSFGLKYMLAEIDQKAKSLSFSLNGMLDIGGNQVLFKVDLFVSLLGQLSYTITTSFILGSAVMKGTISKQNNKTVFQASWTDKSNPIGLSNIASTLGFNLLVPIEFDLNLQSLSILYNFTDVLFAISADSANYGTADLVVFRSRDNTSYILFGGLNINIPISLSDLPLVGGALSSLESVAIKEMKILVSSVPLLPADATWVNQYIGTMSIPNLPKVPVQGMASTIGFTMVFSIGSYLVPLSVGAAGTSTTNLPVGQSSVQGTPSGNLSAPVPSTPAAQSDGTTWFNVEKAIGPVTFRRIGVKYTSPVLWFLLDASFAAGGLTIDLLGMSIGSPVNDFSPQFRLNGLGLSFEQGPFTLAGTLLNVPVKPNSGIDFEYAGGVMIKTAVFSLTAYADYASMNGTPSLFVFGQVTGKFGGPPAFFVTGLAAGFGYNTAVRIPAFNEVYRFPLVAGAQDPSVLGGKDATPAQVLNILLNGSGGSKPWITHEIGQYWFAAGLQFTTYTLVTTNALLLAQFGNRLQFALIGISRAEFPPANSPLPPSNGLPVRYAFVELQVQTVYDVEQGVFSLTAVLSPNSYLLDPTCKLTGGFAFFMWFAPSQNTGDFVITVGGYHPSFNPPKYYPQVPKVGFTWSLDSTVSITGTAYFALTPSAIMAGGGLSVTYQSGKLKAWFKAWANMLIYFSPFHFNFDMGITVGASYTMDLWVTTATIEVQLGAMLKLWGPRTGGTVTVYWWIISFTVKFGEQETKNLAALNWDEFKKSLLPSGELVKITPVDGIQPTGKTDQSGSAWLVRPAGLSFSISSFVPSSELSSAQANFSEASTGINIRPMQQTGLVSKQDFILKRNGQTESLTGWTITSRKENVGKALWGTGTQDQLDQGNDQLVRDQLTGFDVVAPSPSLGASPGEIDVNKNLKYALLTPTGELPVQPGQNPEGPKAQQSTATIDIIVKDIANDPYVQQRDALFSSLKSLGIDAQTNENMNAYKAAAGGLFAAEPLLIPETV